MAKKVRTPPPARAGEAAGSRAGGRPGWRRIVVAATLLGAVAAGAALGWDWLRRPARIAAALPAETNPEGQPQEMRERLQRARALVRDRATLLDGVEEMGRLFHANGHAAEAEACWAILRAERPRDPRWSYYLADLRRLASDNPGMVAGLERTVALAPEYAPAWLRLADVQFKRGELAPAERAYRRRLALVPGDPHARLGLARVALQQGRDRAAREQIEQLVREAPQFSPGHNLHAELLAADGDSARAAAARLRGRDAGRFRAAADPWLDELAGWCFDYERLCVLGTVDNQTKHGDRGRAAFERAIGLRPDALPAYELLGGLYLELGDAASARATYERGLRQARDATPSANYYVNLSRAYRTLRQPAEAARVARDGLARVGEAFELYDALGAALLDLGEGERAVQALRTAVDLHSTDAAVSYNLAVALIGLHRLDEAVDALHASLAAQPTFPPTLALLAQVEIDSGRWDDALKYLQPLYEANPHLPEARAKMAGYHLQAGDHAEAKKDFAGAERHYRAGLAIEPDEPGLQFRLGALSLNQRRFADAVLLLEASHRAQPDDIAGGLFLGRAYAAVGRQTEAREVLTKAAERAERAGERALARECRDLLRDLR